MREEGASGSAWERRVGKRARCIVLGRAHCFPARPIEEHRCRIVRLRLHGDFGYVAVFRFGENGKQRRNER